MMSGSNPTHTTMLFLILFSMAPFKLSYCMGNNTIVCPETEKQSLLNFKKFLKDPENLLSTWDGEVNCCKWEGVVCNNITGNVHQLHLRGRNPGTFEAGLSGKINPSLLNLKHLIYLDLSLNNFVEKIPFFIGSLPNLEYLNLSDCGFHGMIPHNIGNLSNLRTLDLDGNRLQGDSLEWLSGLSQLEYLNMNGVYLRKTTNWAQVINTLPSLLQLHFSRCSLDLMAPLNVVNITSLTFLDLSENNVFQSFAIPRLIFQFSNLLFLDLSWNLLRGPIPTISNATKLQYLNISFNYFNSSVPDWLYFCKDLEFVDLSKNHLEGTISNAIANLTSLNTLSLSNNQLSRKIPREIANLCKIQSLDLSLNELQGEISDSFGNMSECFLGALKFLFLGGNQLSGHLTDQFGEFKSLQFLHLGRNSLSGAIPISIGKLSSLKYLRLFSNKFTGNLPESLGQLFNLEILVIDDNILEGVVTESFFVNLTKLEGLSASGNHFTLKVSPNWVPPFQLKGLRLRSWNLGVGGRIPSWLETQKNILDLDLSNTGISGNIPTWVWKIQSLNLSHNHLHGKFPCIRGPNFVYLSSNQFSGSLPRIGESVLELDLSNNSFSGGISHFLCDMANETYGLEILHLGGNQLSGELPDCWTKWPHLRYLNLGNNNMSGTIPNSIGFLSNLWSLNLYGNNFSGQIPFSLHNCTELVKIDLADNNLYGNIPTQMGTSLVSLRILILRSNRLSGKLSSKLCHLNSLQILDLSDNNFFGIIPRCVYNFTAMATRRFFNFASLSERFFASHSSAAGSSILYYSYSKFSATFIESVSIATKGTELHYDTILSLVTNIDLSKNNLSGDIPMELASLVELRSLSLSENQLTGLIPDNIGDMKQLESLDLSRNFLSGQIPNSFTHMSSLDYLNLSYNKLTGRIPESTQILSFNSSSFIGNDLCGPPLTSNCSYDDDDVHGHKEENEGDESEIEWFYVFLSLGYAVGFSVVCTTLVLKKSWREAYFGFLEGMWDKLYVYVYIKWTRLTKPSGPTS